MPLPRASSAVCKYGDPHCPCQDGDPCHYEGDDPMDPPAITTAASFSCSCGAQFAVGPKDFPAWVSKALRRSAKTLRAFVRMIARTHAGKLPASPEQAAAMSSRIVEDLTDGLAASDLEARAEVLLAAGDIDPAEILTVPDIPFGEAVADVVKRHPKLAPNARAVAQLYRDGPAFAMAKSVELNVTERVQGIVTAFIEKGTGARPTIAEIARQSQDFTDAYAETVLRTNLTTAQTEGMFAQVRDPNIKAAIPAFELTVTRDRDVRRGRKQDSGENHLAADGLIAGVDDPLWQEFSPPFGYRCRCRLKRKTAQDLRRLGLLREDGAVIRRIPRGIGSFAKHPNFTRSRAPFA